MNKEPQTKTKNFVSKKDIDNRGITYQTVGTTLQALSAQLDEGESVYSESGKMSWMTENIELTTHSRGCSKVFTRIFTKESVFLNKFTCTGGTGIVTFTTDQAGKIIPLALKESKPGIIFQKGAYLCSENGVNLTATLVKKLGAGLFGGKGFVMQKVVGEGNVHLIADGEVAMYELKEGQQLSIDQGNLVAYEESVDFDIQTISGAKNWLFGGEGFFIGVLRGPGKVWLQTRKYSLNNIQNYQMGRRRTGVNKIIGVLISIGMIGCFVAFSILSTILNN